MTLHYCCFVLTNDGPLATALNKLLDKALIEPSLSFIVMNKFFFFLYCIYNRKKGINFIHFKFIFCFLLQWINISYFSCNFSQKLQFSLRIILINNIILFLGFMQVIAVFIGSFYSFQKRVALFISPITSIEFVIKMIRVI